MIKKNSNVSKNKFYKNIFFDFF